MPIGDPIVLMPDPILPLVRVTQLPSDWFTIIDAGGMDDTDASLVNPALIAEEDHHIGKVGGKGTTLRIRLKYDDGDSSVTSPVILVFAKYKTTSQWEYLFNKAGAAASAGVKITVDTTNDVTDATDKWTFADPDNHAWDLNGCDEVIVLVKTAYAATGDASLASLEAKVI